MMQQDIDDALVTGNHTDAHPGPSATRRPRPATMSERVHRLRILGRDGSSG